MLPSGVLDEIASVLGGPPEPARLCVDLADGVLWAGRHRWPVEFPAQVVDYVVCGLDEIDRTGRIEAEITRYEQEHQAVPVSVAQALSTGPLPS